MWYGFWSFAITYNVAAADNITGSDQQCYSRRPAALVIQQIVHQPLFTSNINLSITFAHCKKKWTSETMTANERRRWRRRRHKKYDIQHNTYKSTEHTVIFFLEHRKWRFGHPASSMHVQQSEHARKIFPKKSKLPLHRIDFKNVQALDDDIPASERNLSNNRSWYLGRRQKTRPTHMWFVRIELHMPSGDVRVFIGNEFRFFSRLFHTFGWYANDTQTSNYTELYLTKQNVGQIEFAYNAPWTLGCCLPIFKVLDIYSLFVCIRATQLFGRVPGHRHIVCVWKFLRKRIQYGRFGVEIKWA